MRLRAGVIASVGFAASVLGGVAACGSVSSEPGRQSDAAVALGDGLGSGDATTTAAADASLSSFDGGALAADAGTKGPSDARLDAAAAFEAAPVETDGDAAWSPETGGVPIDAGYCPYAASDPVDHDGDGWSGAQGDCDDCDPFINPGAYDIEGDGLDQDCSGTADDEPKGCDSALVGPATTQAADAVQAIDLCRTTTVSPPQPRRTWGVLSADYVLPDGTPVPAASAANFALGFGILGPTFGPMNAARQGSRFFGLSSGTARRPVDVGYEDVSGFDKGYSSGAPLGFPGATPACGNATFGAPHDGAALRLVLRVPTNAATLSFDLDFFSYDFPDFICSTYNDTFVAILSPSPMGEPLAANQNVTFDAMGNALSVNADFLAVCDVDTQAGAESSVMVTYPCPEGPSKLAGTGFGIDTTGDEDHASTDWITTTVPVAAFAGKEVTLLLAVWDSTDGLLDTTVLVDDVHWTFQPSATVPAAPVTVAAE